MAQQSSHDPIPDSTTDPRNEAVDRAELAKLVPLDDLPASMKDHFTNKPLGNIASAVVGRIRAQPKWVDALPKIFGSIADFTRKHPWMLAFAVGSGVLSMAAGPLWPVLGPLRLLGFGGLGPVAGGLLGLV